MILRVTCTLQPHPLIVHDGASRPGCARSRIIYAPSNRVGKSVVNVTINHLHSQPASYHTPVGQNGQRALQQGFDGGLSLCLWYGTGHCVELASERRREKTRRADSSGKTPRRNSILSANDFLCKDNRSCDCWSDSHIQICIEPYRSESYTFLLLSTIDNRVCQKLEVHAACSVTVCS